MTSENSIEARLQQLGIVLPEATQPAGQYANIGAVSVRDNLPIVIDSIFQV